MALYHFSAKMLSRGRRNTVGALAYRAGTSLVDSQNERHDYSEKSVERVELLLPENPPLWIREIQNEIATDRESGVQLFSDRIEAAEKRKDAQIYREIEFALPREFTDQQNKELVDSFLSEQICRRGMAALACYHMDMDEETGEPKPHVHTLLLTRALTEKGLAEKKNLEWNKRELLLDLREQWAAYTNFHLQLNGFKERVDHRSYEERGISLEPQPKLGKNIREMEHKAQEPGLGKSPPVTDKGKQLEDVTLRNMYRLIANPQEILNAVTNKYVTFQWGDIQKELVKYIDDGEVIRQIETKLRASPNLVLLRQGSSDSHDAAIYTTREMVQAEKDLLRVTDRLQIAKSHGVKQKTVHKIIEKANKDLGKKGHALSSDQEMAIRHMVEKGKLSCVVGYAGAGKTTCLTVARDIWEKAGYQVYGVAPTGIAAQALGAKGIKSQNLHGFLNAYKEGRCQYNSNSVLILDEAGMVDLKRMRDFLTITSRLGVKVVLVGDGAQLQPVEAGAPFKQIIQHVSVVSLESIVRQKEEWQREVTKLFGHNHTREALEKYKNQGAISLVASDLTISQFKTLQAERRYENIVSLFRIHHQVSHQMLKDLKREIQEKYFLEKTSSRDVKTHPEYETYQQWEKGREDIAKEILSSSEIYKPYLQNYGISSELLKGEEKRGEGKYIPIDLNACAKEHLLKQWRASVLENPDKTHFILASTKFDVRDLNNRARHIMKEEGLLSKAEYIFTIKKNYTNSLGHFKTEIQKKPFGTGEKIVFTSNDRGLDVKNGMFGTVLKVSRNNMRVRLDGDEGRIVSFSPRLFQYFDQGWTGTVHQSQGKTVTKSYVLISSFINRNLTYVGLSRHEESVTVAASNLVFRHTDHLLNAASKTADKLSVSHYLPLRELEKRVLRDEGILKQKLAGFGHKLEAIGYVTQRSFETIADRFLGRAYRLREGIQPQGTLSEESRAQLMWLKAHASKAPQGNEKSQDEGGGYKSSPSDRSPRDERKSHTEGTQIHLSKVFHDLVPELSRIPDREIRYYDRNEVFNCLSKTRIEDIFRAYRHAWVDSEKSSQRYGNEIRFGSKGSLTVNLHSGQWYSHERQTGGDIFSYVAQSKNVSYKQVLQELGQSANAPLSTYMTREEQLKRFEALRQADEISRQKKEALNLKKREVVEGLYKRSIPIDDTVVAKYLRDDRKITASLPADLRVLQGTPDSPFEFDYVGQQGNVYKAKLHHMALAAFARDKDGSIQAVQLTKLGEDGNRATNLDGEKLQKLKYGVGTGAFATIQSNPESQTVIIAEGVETALSLKETGIKATIVASQGIQNILNYEGPETYIVLAADNDDHKSNSGTHKVIAKAHEHYRSQGKEVTIIKPLTAGYDFNDVLKEEGVSGVESYLQSIRTHQRKMQEEAEETRVPFSKEEILKEEPMPASLQDQLYQFGVVLALQRVAKHLDETVALKYLREECKVKNDLPSDLKFLPAGTQFQYGMEKMTLTSPTLATFARNSDGLVTSVELTSLHEDEKGRVTTQGEKKRYSEGDASFVMIQPNPESQTIIIAESVETALSIREAGFKGSIVAAHNIHTMKHYEGPEKQIVLAFDKEDHNLDSLTSRIRVQAKDYLKTQGKEVDILTPQNAGESFKDVLNQKGVEGIKESFKNLGIEMAPQNNTQEERTTPEPLSFKDKAHLFREEKLGRSSQKDKSECIEWD